MNFLSLSRRSTGYTPLAKVVGYLGLPGSSLAGNRGIEPLWTPPDRLYLLWLSLLMQLIRCISRGDNP